MKVSGARADLTNPSANDETPSDLRLIGIYLASRVGQNKRAYPLWMPLKSAQGDVATHGGKSRNLRSQHGVVQRKGVDENNGHCLLRALVNVMDALHVFSLEEKGGANNRGR